MNATLPPSGPSNACTSIKERNAIRIGTSYTFACVPTENRACIVLWCRFTVETCLREKRGTFYAFLSTGKRSVTFKFADKTAVVTSCPVRFCANDVFEKVVEN